MDEPGDGLQSHPRTADIAGMTRAKHTARFITLATICVAGSMILTAGLVSLVVHAFPLPSVVDVRDLDAIRRFEAMFGAAILLGIAASTAIGGTVVRAIARRAGVSIGRSIFVPGIAGIAAARALWRISERPVLRAH